MSEGEYEKTAVPGGVEVGEIEELYLVFFPNTGESKVFQYPLDAKRYAEKFGEVCESYEPTDYGEMYADVVSPSGEEIGTIERLERKEFELRNELKYWEEYLEEIEVGELIEEFQRRHHDYAWDRISIEVYDEPYTEILDEDGIAVVEKLLSGKGIGDGSRAESDGKHVIHLDSGAGVLAVYREV